MSDLSPILKLALKQLPGIGNALAKAILSAGYNLEQLFRQSIWQLTLNEQKRDFNFSFQDRQKALDQAKAILDAMLIKKVELIFYGEKNYPRRLKHCADAPYYLFYTGQPCWDAQRMVAVIGTRQATEYGRTITQRMTEALVKAGCTIVSGLAYGIDITAHQMALKSGGTTLAVLGSGTDVIYPSAHKKIVHLMMEKGAILSEYPPGTPPEREHFPERNRIVAGMCDAVLLIETGEKGGANITAEIANSYNRDVFAVPGRVNDPMSAGCNQLIRLNKAALISDVNQMLQMMNWHEEKIILPAVQHSLFVDLNPLERQLVDLLQLNAHADIDTLAFSINQPVSKVATELLQLEFKGIVRSLPGKRYQLI